MDLGAVHGDLLRYDVRTASARFRDVETIRDLADRPRRSLRLRDVAAVAIREPLLDPRPPPQP